MPKSTSKKVSVVYKIAERCNINCTYCYFFYGGDESYKKHPPYASLDTTQKLADFLLQGCKDLNLQRVCVGFHGGEPLMVGPAALSKMCDIFNSTLGPNIEVQYTLQTNAMLINDAWIEVFKKYNINPGISLDGPKLYNDQYRLDKRGKSTYEKTVAGIERLSNAFDRKPGILSVINPQADARKIYRHFVDRLGIKSMDFLLPHTSHDGELPGTAEEYGHFLCEAFDEWAKDDDPDIAVRFFSDALDSFYGGYSSVYGRGATNAEYGSLPLLNISSNGDIGPVSELMTTSPDIMHTGYNIGTHSLEQLLKLPVFSIISNAIKTLPTKCQSCCWERVCGGGDLVTRFSKANAFDNPSTLCSGLFSFYSKVANYLVERGFETTVMQENLGLTQANDEVQRLCS